MPGSYSNLVYHLVFSTKERRPSLSQELKPRLREYIRGIVREENGELLEFDGVADHVHILVRLHPARAVAETVRTIKANSSKWINEAFEMGPRFAWQEGYAAFTVSQSQVPRLLVYIRGQEKQIAGLISSASLLPFCGKTGLLSTSATWCECRPLSGASARGGRSSAPPVCTGGNKE